MKTPEAIIRSNYYLLICSEDGTKYFDEPMIKQLMIDYSDQFMKWVEFTEKKPNYGDLIVVQPPPEQLTNPYLTVFDRDTEWIDGCCYVVIKPV